MRARDGSDADASTTATIATAVALPCPSPDAGHTGVVACHTLGPMENWQWCHNHLRILKTVTQSLKDGAKLRSLLWYRMPTLTH